MRSLPPLRAGALFGAFALLSLSAAVPGQAAPPGSARPNLLFIMSDDHAAHALSCYGSRVNETPNLDRIADGGMRFTNCFVTNALCGPARAVILTGKYSHHNGFSRNGDRFDGAQQTFPKLLQQAGYQTAIVGKWHLVSTPQGFDHHVVLPGQGSYVDPVFLDHGERRKIDGHCTDVTTDLALDWLQHERDPERPFLLMLHHKAPHRRWIPAERHRAQWAGRDIPLPETFDDDWSDRASPAANTTMTVEHHLSPADTKGRPPEGLSDRERKLWKQQRYMEDYLACVQGVDENVGRVLDWLDETGLAANTVVVYTSDQGFFLGDHGWYDKRFMYEESLRSPLLVRWPGVAEPGSTSDAMVMNLDFAQTLLDAAEAVPDANAVAGMQGRSLEPILRGATPDDWRGSVYYRYYEYPAVHDVRKHYGVRTATHKLIHFPELGEWELFDLRDDPHELHNRFDDPAAQDTVRTLQAELHRLQELYGDDGSVRDPREARFATTPPRLLADWRVTADDQLRDGGPARLELAATDHRLTGTALHAFPSSDRLDLSFAPFQIEAVLVPNSPDGVVCALGGESQGVALWLQDAVPCFGLRVDRQLFTVRADRPIALGRRTTLRAALDTERQLRIYVSDEPRGTAPGQPLRSLPQEGLSIGADDETLVGNYARGAGVKGELLRLRIGVGSTWPEDDR